MDLKLMILNGHFNVEANYFIIAQLDEIQYPSKERKSYKQRTEIITSTTHPKFKKNIFSFNDLSFGSRLTIKLGVFITKYLNDPENNSDLLKKSKMIGSAAMTLTNKLLSMLRSQKRIEQDLQIIQTDANKEIGRLAVCLKYKPTAFEAHIEDDINFIENIFYDVFETDTKVAEEKSKAVEEQLLQKQKEINKIMQKLSFMKNAHKSVAYDLGNLRDKKENYEKEMIDFRERIKSSNDVDEIHIHIDLLKQTDKGVEVLKQKYAHLTNKLTFERSVYNELSEHYFHIEQSIQRSKELAKEVKEVQAASEEQKFHIKRAEDLLPHIEQIKNTITTQESIIKNLQNTIQTHLKNQDRVTAKDLKVRVQQLQHEKNILKEKDEQIQLMFKLGKGNMDYKEFQKISNDSRLKEDPQEIEYFKKKNMQLMQEIEQATQDLESLNEQEDMKRGKLKQRDFDVHMNDFDRNLIIMEIEQKENQAKSLQEELIRTSKQYAIELSELKIKRSLLDNLIDANSNIKDTMF